MSRTWMTAATAALLAVTACSTDHSPTAPIESGSPNIGFAAFHLTIDVVSGQISVAGPPGSTGTANGPSLSLIGGDVVSLQAGNCTWSNIPGNSKQKRCTFSLSVQNRLATTDLVTPTTFPQLPAGTNGIVVFPFTSASLGAPSNAATPSPDWDNAPANFFNDFGGCSGGGRTSDCYRSETYASPLYSSETSEARTVGFDVDKNAQTVGAYIVVAADIRETTPPQMITLSATDALCGSIVRIDSAPNGGIGYSAFTSSLVVGNEPLTPSRTYRMACSFALPNVRVTKATLRFYQFVPGQIDDPFASGNFVIVDHIDYGNLFTESIYELAPLAANIGTLSTSLVEEYKELDVTASVKNDLTSGRGAAQFRLRFFLEPAESGVLFSGPGTGFPPEVVLTYRVP